MRVGLFGSFSFKSRKFSAHALHGACVAHKINAVEVDGGSSAVQHTICVVPDSDKRQTLGGVSTISFTRFMSCLSKTVQETMLRHLGYTAQSASRACGALPTFCLSDRTHHLGVEIERQAIVQGLTKLNYKVDDECSTSVVVVGSTLQMLEFISLQPLPMYTKILSVLRSAVFRALGVTQRAVTAHLSRSIGSPVVPALIAERLVDATHHRGGHPPAFVIPSAGGRKRRVATVRGGGGALGDEEIAVVLSSDDDGDEQDEGDASYIV
jgi:hypothetical protein